MSRKKVLLICSLFSSMALGLSAIIFCGRTNSFSLANGDDVWYHYNAVNPTSNRHGSKEFWANCSTHEFSLTTPVGGNVYDGVAFDTTSYFNDLTPFDDRYIAPLGDIVDVRNKSFKGKDIVEKNFVYYDTTVEMIQTQTYTFNDDGTYLTSATKASHQGMIIDTVTMSRGIYTQDGAEISITTTEVKISDEEWMVLPEQARQQYVGILDGYNFVLESIYPTEDPTETLILHAIYGLDDWEEISYSDFKSAFNNRESSPYNHVEILYGDPAFYQTEGVLNLYRGYYDLVNDNWVLDESRSDTKLVGLDVFGSVSLNSGAINMFENAPAYATVHVYESDYMGFKLVVHMDNSGQTIDLTHICDKYFNVQYSDQYKNGAMIAYIDANWFII